MMVKKKSGEFRLCFDGRKLNSMTKPDAYPLPFVQDVLDNLRDARYISSIDLRKAFWQIPLDEESASRTAFAVPRSGLFEFTGLHFGLRNASQTLQRLMNNIFGPEPNVLVYLDDIVITSKTFSQHMSLLRVVCRRLREANLTVNLDKCNFCHPSITYLGYIIEKSGLHTDPSKVQAIVDLARPTNSTDLYFICK